MIPSLTDLRQRRLSHEQAQTLANLLRAIALGRLPGEQNLSWRAALTRVIIAVVMSTALWYYVTNQENPVIKSQPFTLQVGFVHAPKGLTVRNPFKTVTVTARGLQDAINSPQQIIPVADLSNVSPSAREATVPITIQGGRSGVDYTSQPGSVTVQLEPVVSKTVQMVFNGQSILPVTLQLNGQDISPKVITVSGPADAVNRVFNATVAPPAASISPPSPDATSFVYQFTSVPLLLDRQGHQLSSVGLLPATARVTVTMQLGVTLLIKTLTVAPYVPFSPPEGYQLDNVEVSPQTVTVFGAPDVISSLKVISTMPIPLQNVTSSRTIITHLDLQGYGNGVILYNTAKHRAVSSGQTGPPWTVYVTISKTQVTDLLPAKVKVDNLSHGLQAQVSPVWEGVYVKGAYVDIKDLGQLTAHVNARGLVQGTYNLKPTVSLPPTLPNYTLTPPTIHVVILPKQH